MYFFYYVPVGLDIKGTRRATITYFLAAIIVIAFFVYRYKPACSMWNLYVLAFRPHTPSAFTAFSHVFLHGGYVHLIGNIVYLVIFGRAVEDRFGPGRYFLIFALSSVVGAYTHLFLVKQLAPVYLEYSVIGASGATSGLLGAFLLRFYFSRVRVAYWVFMPLQGVNRAGRSYVPVIFAILLWLLIQGAQAILQLGSGVVRIAYSIHIGGFTAGIVLASFFGARPAARAERHLVKARRHFEKANWLASQFEFSAYLECRPDDPVVHAEIARALLCTGDTGIARFHYREAIQHFMEGGARSCAEEIFTEAMRLIPDFTLPEEVHLDLSYRMERTLKFHSAARAYENFVKGYPHSSEIPFILLRLAGLCERKFRRFSEALSCYDRIVEEYPEDAWVDFANAQMERLKRTSVVLS